MGRSARVAVVSARADIGPRVSRLGARSPAVRAVLGALGLAVGVGALVHVVRTVGLSSLVEVVLGAGSPALGLALFELASVGLEALSARTLAESTGPTCVRGAIVAYAAAQVLPGGRVVGELARATHIATERGAGRATHAAVVVHGAHVACVSGVLALGAVVLGEHGALSALLVAAAGWNVGLAVVFVTAPRSAPLMSLLARRLGVSVPTDEPPNWSRLACASALVVASRVVHVAQAAFAVWLVTRRGDAPGALAAETLQLLAGAVGDAVPGQAGVIETAFHSFGSVVSPADASRAVGVALLLRASRLGLLVPLALGYGAAGLVSGRPLTSPDLVAGAR
jgi:hypothetical protein